MNTITQSNGIHYNTLSTAADKSLEEAGKIVVELKHFFFVNL